MQRGQEQNKFAPIPSAMAMKQVWLHCECKQQVDLEEVKWSWLHSWLIERSPPPWIFQEPEQRGARHEATRLVHCEMV